MAPELVALGALWVLALGLGPAVRFVARWRSLVGRAKERNRW